jgi:transcription termination factor NusB
MKITEVTLALALAIMIMILLIAVTKITMNSLQPYYAAAVEVVVIIKSVLSAETVHHQINATLDKEIARVTVIASMA